VGIIFFINIKIFSMKKFYLLIVAFVFFFGNLLAQAPQQFNYQVIARDADGNPLINQSVNFRISLLQGSAAGTVVYMETHALTTNDFGLATMAIGGGSVVTGVFSSISWGTDSYYVRTELDPTGGSSFTFAGVTQLLSVPYALYANASGSGGSAYTAGSGIDITGTTISNTMPNVTHSGDAIGGNELSVVRIQGRDVLATPPMDGQVLTWDSDYNAWEPSNAESLAPGSSGQTLRNDGTGWVANSLLFNDNTNIGIGTTTPSALLHVNGTGVGKGNVVFTGDQNYFAGPVPVSGAGTRMMWYPDKGAFRVGGVAGDEWDTENIGFSSVAMGFGTIASFDYTTAIGLHSNASGMRSTAIGSYCTSSGSGATAIGESSTATSLHSTVFGTGSNATGTYSCALGNEVTASGYQSCAIGTQSEASGSNSMALGYEAIASGWASKCMGFYSNATGNHSVVLGDYLNAPSMSETVIGNYNTNYTPSDIGAHSFQPWDRLFVIGNGTGSDSRSNALTMLKNGNTGLGTDFPETQLHTTGSIRFEGAGTPGAGKVLTSDEIGNATWQTMSGGGGLPAGTAGQTLRHNGADWVANSLLFNNGTSLGVGTTAPSALFHVNGTGTGEGNVLFTGEIKYWEPGEPPASGMGTRMMWYPDKAAFRVGGVFSNEWDNENTGHYSVATGYGTISKGYASTAMGLLSSSTGFASTALGYMTSAPETSCLATGYNTKATGSNSTAMGNNTIAPSFCETVIGRFNTPYTLETGGAANWKSGDRLFVIANGPNSDTLRNAMTVLKNGKIGIGTDSPTAQLHTNGTVRFEGAGTPGQGKVLTSDASGNATWKGYTIGDFAQGGIIYWLDESGQHGLVIAKSDQSPGIRWYAGTFGATRALGDGPYSGEMNTSIIIAAQVAIGDDGNTYAARLCNELQITEGTSTYGDWYLPSKEELGLLIYNKELINSVSVAHGGTSLSNSYLSSTERVSTSAWGYDFLSAMYFPVMKDDTRIPVRAIRAF
jgi:hypothetical protein